MITNISTVHVFVRDYDEALAFYTTKLGFELQMDAPMGPDQRWVQLAPKGAQTSLVLAKPASGMPDYDKATASIGSFANFIFNVDDLEATYRELSAREVEFVDKPAKQDWGWWATMKDQDGNTIGLHANA